MENVGVTVLQEGWASKLTVAHSGDFDMKLHSVHGLGLLKGSLEIVHNPGRDSVVTV